jgi:ubiquinone/menaquinone biosynthesis C-methylase UbiE
MRNAEGFNHWTKDYDHSVKTCKEDDSYPFAGYTEVLSKIEKIVLTEKKHSVLDLGFGTATLTTKLYREGCQITGVDFSSKMMDQAREKMPLATLIQADFTSGLPRKLDGAHFDFILGTYSLHHVSHEKQEDFFQSLSDHLSDGGKILAGDIIFRNQEEYDRCHEKYASVCDGDEVYPIMDGMTSLLSGLGLCCSFEQISFCSGILLIQKANKTVR